MAPLAGVASIGIKALPEKTYSTPVLGAVGVLLDVRRLSPLPQRMEHLTRPESMTNNLEYKQAVKQTANVRKEVLEGFDGLIPIFSDVELFLGDFPGDPHIKDASVGLAITILTALEQAIGFFTSNECGYFTAIYRIPKVSSEFLYLES